LYPIILGQITPLKLHKIGQGLDNAIQMDQRWFGFLEMVIWKNPRAYAKKPDEIISLAIIKTQISYVQDFTCPARSCYLIVQRETQGLRDPLWKNNK
jgi:hypothetical protein